MVGNTSSNDRQFSVGMLLPGSAAYVEALVRGSRALCDFVQGSTHEHNKELCECLGAFLFRIASERYEGRLSSEERMVQLQLLFDCISAYVNESERKNLLTELFSATKEQAQVDQYRDEIKSLQLAMVFRGNEEPEYCSYDTIASWSNRCWCCNQTW